MKFDEVGTAVKHIVKHIETINGNVKNLSQMIENER